MSDRKVTEKTGISRGMLVTDLDGTLTESPGKVSERTRAGLRILGEKGVTRVIATGRTLHSARKCLGDDFPIDYLIFASGAGIFEWATKTVLHASHLRAEEVTEIHAFFARRELAFIIHEPIPDNHFFTYHTTKNAPKDFHTRLERSGAFGRPFRGMLPQSASEFFTVGEAHSCDALVRDLSRELSSFSVLRVTSPLDRVSAWIEVFPAGVSKSRAAQWIGDRVCVKKDSVLAVGNDHNDVDLLEWAGQSRIVGDGVPALLGRFPKVGASYQDGVLQAIEEWLGSVSR